MDGLGCLGKSGGAGSTRSCRPGRWPVRSSRACWCWPGRAPTQTCAPRARHRLSISEWSGPSGPIGPRRSARRADRRPGRRYPHGSTLVRRTPKPWPLVTPVVAFLAAPARRSRYPPGCGHRCRPPTSPASARVILHIPGARDPGDVAPAPAPLHSGTGEMLLMSTSVPQSLPSPARPRLRRPSGRPARPCDDLRYPDWCRRSGQPGRRPASGPLQSWPPAPGPRLRHPRARTADCQ